MDTKYAMMILACDRHAQAVAQRLDETGISNWIIVPAVQARRMGFLQDVPQHRHGNTALFAFADRKIIVQALQTLAQAEQNKDLCPDCVAFVWKVQQTVMTDVALDPVCEEVVDRRNALTTVYNGTSYYFCSVACLNAFNERPAVYVERVHLEQRIGRRELVSPVPKQETDKTIQRTRPGPRKADRVRPSKQKVSKDSGPFDGG